ncbi:SxtJ family membrane protein [Stieleria varia]|uniref:SxtJ n=1 Tax=Stieleria varia TaxID=2528005 RepID=A0A5C6B4A7_9BACT|nr:SxtJ family membrane protein [Stieleria varia]TWU06392.1 hypothetical protein Pla52n_21130 [Stieleria varia]
MFAQQELTDQQLKYFGLSLSGLLLALAAVTYWTWHAGIVAAGLVIGAVVLLAIYYATASARRPIYRGFRIITFPIQWMMTWIVLGLVYFLVLTPIGLVLRLAGKSLRQKYPDSSLWQPRTKEDEPSGYFKTY